MRTVDKLRIAFGAIVTSTGACAGTTAPRPSAGPFWPGPPSSSSAEPFSSAAQAAMSAAANAEYRAWDLHELLVSRQGAVRMLRTVPVLKGHVCGVADQLNR